MRLRIILITIGFIFYSCKSKTFTIQLIPVSKEAVKTADGILVYNQSDVKIFFKVVELHNLIKEKLHKSVSGSDSKNRVPDLTYIQYKIENQSKEDIFINFKNSRFSQKDVYVSNVINKREFGEKYTSASYQYLKYDHLFSVYDQQFTQGKKNAVCAPLEPCLIKSGKTVWYILPYQLIIPYHRKVAFSFIEPYYPKNILEFKKKDVQFDFYLKNNR